jgi:phosphoglycerate dehydrogenase-like enzyme
MTILIYTDTIQAHATIPERFPQVAVHVTDRADEFEAAVPDAEVIFIARKYAREQLAGYRRLRWLHLGGTGINPLLPLSEWPPEILLTHTPGLNAPMIADYVQAIIAMLAWNFPRFYENQRKHLWQKWGVERLEGKTVALVGLGNIGRAVVPRARAAGMRVVAIKRSPTPMEGVERVVAPEQLHAVLSQADFVVLALPLTQETRGLMDEAALRAMRQSAFLINVSRGAIVDETALIAALQQGQIAGAALDVFEQEPLPPESPLWDAPNVILTPHVSSWSEDYRARAAEVFCQNLERYLNGQPLLNPIVRSREY